MRSSFLALLVLATLCSVFAHPFTDCSSAPGHVFQVSSVNLNPDPPARAQNAQITVSGVLSAPVTAGSVNLVITYVPVNLAVFKQNYDLCALLTCPIPAGPISGTITVPATAVPSFAPAGQYSGVGTFTDNTGAQLACVSTSFVLPQ